MSRTSSTRLSKRSVVWGWLVALKKQGLKKFRFSELPSALRNISMLRQAVSYNLLACAGRWSDGTKVWELSNRVE